MYQERKDKNNIGTVGNNFFIHVKCNIKILAIQVHEEIFKEMTYFEIDEIRSLVR